MMFRYNVLDWYWAVAGSTTQVWSSKRSAFVSVTDADYLEWQQTDGCNPTRISSATDLYGVLTDQWVPLVQAGGVTITSTATSALNGTYAIDVDAQAKISALATGMAAGKPLPGGGTTFNYPDMAGVMHAFSSANFQAFASAVANYIYNFEQTLLDLLNGGAGSLPSVALTIA